MGKEPTDFVSSLLVKNPNKRLDAQSAMDHPWLSDSYHLSDRRPEDVVMDCAHESMINYSDGGEFKKLALNVIAHKSTPAEVGKMRQVFDQFAT